MKILIAGAGKVGGAVAADLAADGHDITIIEQDPAVITAVSNVLDVICLEGSAANPQNLKEAGAADADLFIAATESDEVNMVCGITAGKLGAKYVIARIRNPEYLNSRDFLSSALGINMVVNPEYECAAEISRILRFPGADRIDTFADGRIELVKCHIGADNALNGLSLRDLPSRFSARVLVSIAERDGKAMIPNGTFTIQAGDRLTIAGEPKEMRSFFIATGLYRKPIHTAILMGGSRIAVYLARTMLSNGIAVTVIERDRSRCNELCDLIPGAKIIFGDATHTDVLLEEGIEETDAFISLSGEDGYNVVSSLFAKSCDVPKVITKINNENLAEILTRSGLDTFVTAKELVVQRIARYARGKDFSKGSSMESLQRLADGNAEALEFFVKEGALCSGIPLKTLKLLPDVLICAIKRAGKIIIPGGNDVILPGDTVLIVTLAGRFTELDDIIENTI